MHRADQAFEVIRYVRILFRQPFEISNRKTTDMHDSYDIKLSHPADFRVRYRFYTKEEGGRSSLPFQGYRCDFWYDHGNETENQLFMIWPEFENTDGQVIFQIDCPVPLSGIARMWIVIPERRPYHSRKIKLGLLGYFMEGGKKVAECEVIELVGLLNNPIKRENSDIINK